MQLLRYIATRLNVKAIAMLICFLLVIGGALMIFIGIRDEGFIDVKSPFLTGQAKSGFVGVLLIFCAVIMVLGSMYTRKSYHEFTIKKSGNEVHWKGTFSTAEELDMVHRMVHDRLLTTGQEESGHANPPESCLRPYDNNMEGAVLHAAAGNPEDVRHHETDNSTIDGNTDEVSPEWHNGD